MAEPVTKPGETPMFKDIPAFFAFAFATHNFVQQVYLEKEKLNQILRGSAARELKQLEEYINSPRFKISRNEEKNFNRHLKALRRYISFAMRLPTLVETVQALKMHEHSFQQPSSSSQQPQIVIQNVGKIPQEKPPGFWASLGMRIAPKPKPQPKVDAEKGEVITKPADLPTIERFKTLLASLAKARTYYRSAICELMFNPDPARHQFHKEELSWFISGLIDDARASVEGALAYIEKSINDLVSRVAQAQAMALREVYAPVYPYQYSPYGWSLPQARRREVE